MFVVKTTKKQNKKANKQTLKHLRLPMTAAALGRCQGLRDRQNSSECWKVASLKNIKNKPCAILPSEIFCVNNWASKSLKYGAFTGTRKKSETTRVVRNHHICYFLVLVLTTHWICIFIQTESLQIIEIYMYWLVIVSKIKAKVVFYMTALVVIQNRLERFVGHFESIA